MSTHNIGFYEDLTKDIFQLSSNIIKYVPYLFFCLNNYYSSCSIKITDVAGGILYSKMHHLNQRIKERSLMGRLSPVSQRTYIFCCIAISSTSRQSIIGCVCRCDIIWFDVNSKI